VSSPEQRGIVALLLFLSLTSATPADSGPYVRASDQPDGIAILPPPPAPGSPREIADRALFRATRKLRGSARWRIATDDVENSALDRYACALGARVAPAQVPMLAAVLDRTGTGDLVGPVKAHYHRDRPYLADPAPICQAKTPHLAQDGDYPSGHASNGWLEGLILAELAPERATAILARARQYGESRFICGAHSRSAVEAGWLAGSAEFAVLHGSPAFRRDMDQARAELTVARRVAPAPQRASCQAETAVLQATPAF
jgi:acid phosphatase (class A)